MMISGILKFDLSATRPGRATSGPPSCSSWHDSRPNINFETASESLPHKNMEFRAFKAEVR